MYMYIKTIILCLYMYVCAACASIVPSPCCTQQRVKLYVGEHHFQLHV